MGEQGRDILADLAVNVSYDVKGLKRLQFAHNFVGDTIREGHEDVRSWWEHPCRSGAVVDNDGNDVPNKFVHSVKVE